LLVVAGDALMVASLLLFSGSVYSLRFAELVGVDLSDAPHVGRIARLSTRWRAALAALVYLILDIFQLMTIARIEPVAGHPAAGAAGEILAQNVEGP
jgi:hypothetical protein